MYDNSVKKHIAHIAYNPNGCSIYFLLVDQEYRNQGIGKELVHRAIEDMRINYNCKEIYLDSSSEGREFWRHLGAKWRGGSTYVLPSNLLE